MLDADECRSIANEAVCVAAARFDPSFGYPFRQWVLTKACQVATDLARCQTKRRPGGYYSARATAVVGATPDGLTVEGPTVVIDRYPSDHDDELAAAAHALRPLSARDRGIVAALVNGATMAEAGAAVGVTESRVYQIVAGMRRTAARYARMPTRPPQAASGIAHGANTARIPSATKA